jgi:D-alanine transaminase
MEDALQHESGLAWFNGEFLPLGEIRISPFDRGFLFADGVYEGLRWYPGCGVFRFADHLRRLGASLEMIRLDGVDLSEFERAVPELIRRNGLADSDATVYLQVTRGVAPRTHSFPDPPPVPTRLALVRSFRPLTEAHRDGVAVTLVEDLRWGRCDIKSISLLANVLAKEDAIRSGTHEAVFVREGRIIEGSHTAVVVVRDGALVAPPNGPELLPSVTRDVVLEIAAELGIDIVLRPIRVDELERIEEMLLLGTSTEVLPAIRIDGLPVGPGTVGPVARRLQRAWPDRG